MSRRVLLIPGLLFAALVASSQRLTWYEKLLLLKAPRIVSGVVVDERGRPVADAHIDYSGVSEREQLFTGDRGRFQIRARSPAMVVRKLGYSGQLIRAGANQRIVLHPAVKTLAVCATKCDSLRTPSSVFCFAAPPGIEASDPGRYETTVVRSFTIRAQNGAGELLHGAGPTWSLGIPYTGDVWESTEYSEKTYQWNGSDVIDARGRGPDGKRWRYLGRFGESASYYEAGESTAAAFDRIMDGVCIAPKADR